ncbi:MAG: tetratricopeptide repeat protein, partial [Candidatus Rifleibacteriota bacterium]
DDFLQPRLYAKSEAPGMIPYLLKLQKQNPTSAQITRKLAATCLKNGQPREALYWYTQTYQRDRSDLEALWNMAALAYQLGEEDQAEKYLKEYADADPNSAWGRMAKEFSAGRFSGTSMDKGFKSEFSKFGSAVGPAKKINYGPVRSEKKSGEGILIIEGRRTTVEQFVEEYEPAVPAEPVALKDTAKGKSGKASVKTQKESKVNLEKAQIAAPEPKQPVTPDKTEPSDLKAVTTTAEPLGTSP